MKYNHLTAAQRYAIFQTRAKGMSIRSIAKLIDVHPSTVSRELKRNSLPSGAYIHQKAQLKAESRRSTRPGNRSISPTLVWRITQLIIEQQWSPQQISGALAREGISVSHETIYKIVRKDTTGKLAMHMRHQMRYRRKHNPKHITKATNIPDRISIHQRPEPQDGNLEGMWEMDTIIGKDGKGAILTLKERSTQLLLMTKLKKGKNAKEVAKEVVRLLLPFKGKMLKNITTDNGSEFAKHQEITKKLGVVVYFADAYASWQKGSIENTNKLIRQYIPKGVSFEKYTDKRIMSIQKKINSRPRKALKYNTPIKAFYQLIQ